MSTPAINGSTPVTTPSISVGGGGFISPDMILQYVAGRLGRTDEQMRGIMEKQREMEKHGQILSDLADELGRWQQKGVGGNEAQAMLKAYDKAIDAAGGENSPLGSQLKAAKNRIECSINKGTVINGDGDNYASSTEMGQALQEITRIQSDVSRGGEMMMMKLQSLASQRQQIIQFATNTIAGLGESAKAIAANTGK